MFSKVLPKSIVSVLGVVLALSIGIGISGNTALAENPPEFPGLPDECSNNSEFTTEFRLEDCKFKDNGENPFFILKPGYQIVLESEDEKSVETVLRDKKNIHYNNRKIKTRVLEERALEWDEDEAEWVTIEISLNYFAICKKTNAVYYFGEWSRVCEDGFDENDDCEDENNDGSWEAGVDGAMPGVVMPGTPMLGAKYFQEIAPPDAADRGEIAVMGLDVNVPAGEWSGCIEIFDTNPTMDGECGEDDAKLYCPGVGLVKDQDLELVSYGFGGDKDGDDDDDDDDDDHDHEKKNKEKW